MKSLRKATPLLRLTTVLMTREPCVLTVSLVLVALVISTVFSGHVAAQEKGTDPLAAEEEMSLEYLKKAVDRNN